MVVQVEVGARVAVPEDELPAGALEELREQHTYSNPQYHKQKAMGVWPSEPKEIATWGEEKRAGRKYLTLPRGRGLPRLRAALEAAGLDWDEEDRRTVGDLALPLYTGDYVTPQRFPKHSKVPWPHQERIAQAALERECSLVLSPTGSGKTTAVLMAIAEANLPALVVVWDTGLMEQWAKDITAAFGIPASEIGHVQGKKRKLRSITLAMQQTLNRMAPAELLALASRFGFVALDEVIRAAASTYTGTVDAMPCKYRMGVNAPGGAGGLRRKDGKQFLIYDLLGEPCLEVSKDEVVEAGFVVDVAAVLVPTQFSAPWYVRQLEESPRPDFNRLLDEMVADQERNAQVARLVAEQAGPGRRRSLVFTHRVEHAVQLRAMLEAIGVPAGLMLGGERREEFTATKRDLLSGRLLAGVGTYGALGVGHDLPTVELGVVATPVHQNRDYLGQVSGRVCRSAAGKDDARIVVLWDRAVFGDRPARSLARWYRQSAVLEAGAMIPVARYLERNPLPEEHDDRDETPQRSFPLEERAVAAARRRSGRRAR